MSNRKLNKNFAIALGALIGGTGALNSVQVSATEKNDQREAINDLNEVLDIIIDVSNGNECWLGERFGRCDFLPRKYIDEVLSEIDRLCRRAENLPPETKQKIKQVTLYLTRWAVENENDGYRRHDVLASTSDTIMNGLDDLVNKNCPDFDGKEKVKEIVERHWDHQNELAKSIFDQGISETVIDAELEILDSLIDQL